MKINVFLPALALTLALISVAAAADETVITTDGRYIWLKADGTYQVVPPQAVPQGQTYQGQTYRTPANPYGATPYGGYAYPYANAYGYPAYGPPSGQPVTGQPVPVQQVPAAQPAATASVDEEEEEQGLIQWLLSDEKAEKTHNPKR